MFVFDLALLPRSDSTADLHVSPSRARKVDGRGPWIVLVVALTSAQIAACGSDAGSSSADTATTSDTTDAAVDVVAGPKDQCQNTEDLAWLKGSVGNGQTGRELAREAAGDCGLGCLNHPAPDQCAINCMVKDKGVKLTTGCAGCYGGIVICTIEKCLPKCIDDAQAQICKDCQDQKGCQGVFYDCTGNLD